MTKTEFRAYTKGHDTAIFKGACTNPFGTRGKTAIAWTEGYKRGRESVVYHTRTLHTNKGRSNDASWVGGYEPY